MTLRGDFHGSNEASTRAGPQSSNPPGSPGDFDWERALAAAASLALGIAALDILIGQLEARETHWSFADCADSAGLTALAVCVVFLGTWLVTWPLRRARLVRAAHLAAALACGAIGLHVGLALLRLPRVWLPVSELAPALVLAAVAAVGAQALAARRGAHPLALSTSFLGAACAIELALIGHAEVGVLALVLLATLAAALCGPRIATRRPVRVAVLVLFAAVALFPLVTFVRTSQQSAGSAGSRGGADGVPRTILIVVDTLRADELTCYGGPAGATPALDDLAADGVVFETARAPAGWTRPSMASILTGLSPLVHGSTEATRPVPLAAPRLAEDLRAAGWRTAAFGENALLLPYSGLARGFERYDIFPHYESNPPLGQLLMKAFWGDRLLHNLLAPDVNRFALSWFDERPDVPAFAWLHYLDVHQPYTPAARFRPTGDPPPGMTTRFGDLDDVRLGYFVPTPPERAWIRSLYRAEIRQLDAEIGHLLEELKRRGWYDDATIVFTSDHGEEFWEHEGYEHGHTLYDELLRVPLIVKLPRSLGREPGRAPAPVTVESITPTLLTLAGLDPDPARSSAPSLFTRVGELAAAGSPEVLLSDGNARFPDRTAIIARGHKYVRWDANQRDPAAGLEELYDLAADPGERRSLAESDPALLAEFRALFDETVADARALAERLGLEPSGEEELDDATRAELRALGYVR